MPATLAKVALPQDSMEHMEECEFCREFRRPLTSTFYKNYRLHPKRRQVADIDAFRVIAAMGQLFTGTVLVIPFEHVETTAALEPSRLAQLEDVLREMRATVSRLGRVFVFEHGAQSNTGAASGIYHAHVHIVPLPGDVSTATVLPSGRQAHANLRAALAYHRHSKEYLLCCDTSGQWASIRVTHRNKSQYPSQYFRRILHGQFHPRHSWNWRTTTRERSLLTVATSLRRMSQTDASGHQVARGA